MKHIKSKLHDCVRRDLVKYGSYERVAKHRGISASTLFRLEKQNWQRLGPVIRKAIAVYNIELSTKRPATECTAVLDVISEVWDGTNRHAKLLARILNDMHSLSDYYTGDRTKLK